MKHLARGGVKQKRLTTALAPLHFSVVGWSTTLVAHAGVVACPFESRQKVRCKKRLYRRRDRVTGSQTAIGTFHWGAPWTENETTHAADIVGGRLPRERSSRTCTIYLSNLVNPLNAQRTCTITSKPALSGLLIYSTRSLHI